MVKSRMKLHDMKEGEETWSRGDSQRGPFSGSSPQTGADNWEWPAADEVRRH